jgi:uncharacterized protein (TIGR03437 family)
MRVALSIAILLLPIAVMAQPRVTAVANGASFQAVVSPGSFASAFGENLASTAAVTPTANWPTELGGVSVTVNGTAAPIHSVRNNQINFQVPRNTPAGQATIVVRNGTASSAAFSFQVVASAPGILVFGNNLAVAQHADGSIVTRENPLQSQEAAVIYFTGIGPVNNPTVDGAPSPSSPLASASLPVSATVGGRNAPIAFIGLTPGFVGLGQLNITTPDLAPGDHPVVLTIGGTASASAAPVLSVGSAATGLLTRLGSVGTASGNLSLAVRDNVAYVCSETGGISVVDVANANAPRLVTVNTQVPCRRALFLPEHLVALRAGQNTASVTTLSLANPLNPVRSGGPVATPFPFTENFILARNHIFVTTLWFQFQGNRIFAQHGELFSVNLQNPTAPANASTLRSDGNPATSNESPFYSILGLNDDTALLLSTTATGENTSTGIGRVVVTDISNPASLAAPSQLLVPGTHMFHGGAVEGTTALLMGNTSGWTSPGDFAIRGDVTLTTLDVSDPRSPRTIVSVRTTAKNTFTAASVVSLGGGFFAGASFNRPEDRTDTSILILDARNPASPSIDGKIDIPSIADAGLLAAGNRLYVATASGLTIYQIR